MQILGLYTNGTLRNILKTLKELHDVQLFLPIVLTLERESFISVTDHIGIFPAFYSVDRCATIHQVLAQSFCKDQGNTMVTKVENIAQLSIDLIDPSDMPSIYALAKDMAVSFPQIGWLNVRFNRRCEIVSLILTVTITLPYLKGIRIISQHRSLKKNFLSSPSCVGYSNMTGSQYDDLNIPEDG